jgi:hypothetical protein
MSAPGQSRTARAPRRPIIGSIAMHEISRATSLYIRSDGQQERERERERYRERDTERRVPVGVNIKYPRVITRLLCIPPRYQTEDGKRGGFTR